jgi:hypothetical protein
MDSTLLLEYGARIHKAQDVVDFGRTKSSLAATHMVAYLVSCVAPPGCK